MIESMISDPNYIVIWIEKLPTLVYISYTCIYSFNNNGGRREKILQESQVPEVHDKYRQSPILQRKLSEVLQTQSMERCL